ncbi:ATP synthase F1 subunit epsilon [Streptobacillus felis]|uniref:ATP synthase epsilon chain n=1 Tax=Streptobacillus felis TaxID=1384509 RepID=A0A7Z0PH77_9FUSO|nr:ATP synthase F1 subunit epsilon [Streptobacillus felis]NYV27970.1 ATP synthase F1 subunit epsilon [Streptobacillus felis]
MEKKDFFTLKVVTPEKIEYLSKETKYIKVRTIRGDIGILPNHTNFMSSLGEGLMLLRTSEEEKTYYISGGFLEVNHNYVTVMAEEAMLAESEEEYKKIKQEKLEEAIAAKKKEDQDILGTKKRLQDSLLR